MTRALLIMGPTASGKSALAIAAAQKLGGEIVNADSMQVYADLRVLSARPSPAEEAAAPHHLFGRIDAAERYSTGRWLADVAPLIAAIQARGKIPILVGGTGLYFKVLTEGIAPAPAGTPAVRSRLNAELAAVGAAGLHARLATLDPAAAARIRPSDSVRLVRALEVHESGGEIASLTRKDAPLLTDWDGFVLTPPRAVLYAAIEKRLDQMVAEGAIEEVRRLMARALDPDMPAVKAHGVPPFSAYLRGEIDLETAIAHAKRDTRHYAKRQFTWIRNQTPGWTRIETTDPAERLKQLTEAN